MNRSHTGGLGYKAKEVRVSSRRLLRRLGFASDPWLLAFVIVGLTSCRSAQPPPPRPTAFLLAERTAAQAAKLSTAENWSAAAREWQHAADRFALVNDRVREANAWHELGRAQAEQGGFESARRSLEHAAALHQSSPVIRESSPPPAGARREWWRDQIALLQVEARAGWTNELGERFRLLDGLTAPGDSALAALLMNERGLWHLGQSEFTEAARRFAEAETSFRVERDAFGLATVAANKALLLEAQREFVPAAQQWQLALTQFEPLGESRAIAMALAGQGRCWLAARQHLDVAEDLLHRAARNFRILRLWEDERRTLDLLLQSQQKLAVPPELP